MLPAAVDPGKGEVGLAGMIGGGTACCPKAAPYTSSAPVTTTNSRIPILVRERGELIVFTSNRGSKKISLIQWKEKPANGG
jgi:hypothetical protein